MITRSRSFIRLVVSLAISDNREIVVDPTHQFLVPFFIISKEFVEVTKTIVWILEVLFYL